MSTIITTSYMLATTPLQPGAFESSFEGFGTEQEIRDAQSKIMRGEYALNQDIVIGGFDFHLDLIKTDVYDDGTVLTNVIGGSSVWN